MRTFFGEIAIGPSGPAVEVACFNDSHNTLILGLILFKLYLKIPLWFSDGYDIERGYGFSFTRDGLHWHWGTKTRVYWYPWSWDHYRTAILRPDGSIWKDFWKPTLDGRGVIPETLKERHPYRYLLDDPEGTVQRCTATVNGREMEWRLRCAKWLPWPRLIRRTIDVEFSEEMGSGRGSWKGGVLGTGAEWRRGESMRQALRRMERERRFGR